MLDRQPGRRLLGVASRPGRQPENLNRRRRGYAAGIRAGPPDVRRQPNARLDSATLQRPGLSGGGPAKRERHATPGGWPGPGAAGEATAPCRYGDGGRCGRAEPGWLHSAGRGVETQGS